MGMIDMTSGDVGKVLYAQAEKMMNPGVRRQIWRTAMNHPLVRRAHRKAAKLGTSRLITADDVLAERILMQADTVTGMHSVIGGFGKAKWTSPYLKHDDDPEGQGCYALRALLGSLVSISTPYLWLDEIRNRVVEMKVPPHVIGPKIRGRPMWWTFEHDLAAMHGTTQVRLHAMLLHEAHDCLELTMFLSSEEGTKAFFRGDRRADSNVHICGEEYEFGKRWPDDFKKENAFIRRTVGDILAMLAFLASPHVPRHTEEVSQRMKREAKRAGVASSVSRAVHFIDLRRQAKGGKSDKRTTEQKERDFQWLVSGHFRSQWYPSKQCHEVIWIAPYVKGPEGKPLKEVVYRVKR
jgi:hypothetical protein